MIKYFFFALCIIIIFINADCKDEPTKSIETPQDTTSHNFVVTRVDTLGDLFSSARAVDILNENDIWVAGEFYEKDTVNNYNLKYNLAHWNGIRWSLTGVKMQGFGGTADTSVQPLITIKIFSDSNIIVTSQYNSFARFNGKNWLSLAPSEGVWEHFWGFSASDIYFVGSLGRATHYNGQVFTKMMTGLTSNAVLTDLWGDENTVYTLGSSNDMKENVILYSRNANNWTVANSYSIDNKIPAYPNEYMGRLYSIFRLNKNSKLWVVGGEDHGWLYEITSLSPFAAKRFFIVPDVFFPRWIRGNADNDLFLLGEMDAKIWHYNASTWKLIEPSVNNFLVKGCCVKNNNVVVVGESIANVVGRGIIVTLKRD